MVPGSLFGDHKSRRAAFWRSELLCRTRHRHSVQVAFKPTVVFFPSVGVHNSRSRSGAAPELSTPTEGKQSFSENSFHERIFCSRLVERLLSDREDADSGLLNLRLPEHDGERLDNQSAESAGKQQVAVKLYG